MVCFSPNQLIHGDQLVHHSTQPAATPNVVVTGKYIVGWVVNVTIIAVLGGR